MSFRRTKEQALGGQSWRAFVQEKTALISQSTVPDACFESLERFQDLLMHGCVSHFEDPSRFDVDRLPTAARRAFGELVEGYFAAGFPNPGLAAVSHEEKEALQAKYPEAFAPS